ncbi:MAG: DUF3603 family protein [Bacilli bacterium]|nr:DUF3603 family protein [Bacilli bacterium]
MNYIYDIYLNLNETLYDFFDWNKNDKLTHIKKIPIFKVDEETLKNLIYNKILINEDFLLQIYNKTEIWNMNGKINYCALFSDNNTIIAIEFDKKGNSIKKSFLFIDEELEVLEIVYKLKERCIDFNILNKEKNIFKTRKQIKEEKFINNELRNMDDNKLNYIYFECFGKQEKNKKIILDRINKISKNSKTYKNLYDILKLTSTTKK